MLGYPTSINSLLLELITTTNKDIKLNNPSKINNVSKNEGKTFLEAILNSFPEDEFESLLNNDSSNVNYSGCYDEGCSTLGEEARLFFGTSLLQYFHSKSHEKNKIYSKFVPGRYPCLIQQTVTTHFGRLFKPVEVSLCGYVMERYLWGAAEKSLATENIMEAFKTAKHLDNPHELLEACEGKARGKILNQVIKKHPEYAPTNLEDAKQQDNISSQQSTASCIIS